jgi:hypothetical protein
MLFFQSREMNHTRTLSDNRIIMEHQNEFN